jgi:23S rRNA pseudouridine2605 synthase
MRVNKFIASSINISRRAADDYVKAGRVSVNGKIINNFIDIDEKNDVVIVDGNIVKPAAEKLYFAFYKPAYVLTAVRDSSKRKVVCDYFKNFNEKLICVGRLDYLSEGLLIVTNDGNFANMVMHPKFKIRKTYLIKTKSRLSEEEIKEMSRGVRLEDGFFKPLDIKLTKDSFWVVTAIDSGRSRVLRRFFKAFNVPILKLKRIAIGSIELGNLEMGMYRKIDPNELIQIKT